MAGKTYQLKADGLYKFICTNGDKLAFVGGSSYPLTVDCHDNMNVMGRTTISGSGYSAGCRLEIVDNNVNGLLAGTGTYGFDSDQVNIKYSDDFMMGINHRGHFKNKGNNFYFYNNAGYGSSSDDAGDLNFAIMQSSGDVHAAGDVVAYSTSVSDIRLKNNIRPITGSLEALCKLDGIKFDWKHRPDDKNHLGVIAQQVEKYIPEVVVEKKLPLYTPKNTDPITGGGEFDYGSSKKYKTVRYAELVPHLIEAIKELKLEIDILKNKLNK